MTDDGVHSLHLEEGRSAVVSISSPRLWKVLVAFDGGLRSQRASSPPPSARDTVENGKSVSVDVNSKTASDAGVRWLSMFDVAVDVNVIVDGDVHVHAP